MNPHDVSWVDQTNVDYEGRTSVCIREVPKKQFIAERPALGQVDFDVNLEV
jgi:hypothetical protein